MINTDAATKASREEILTILKSMTENAADYTFIFVGNVNTATLKPLVEKYLAVLPGKASQKANPKDVPSLDIAKGSATVVEKMEMQTPQTYVAIISSADIPYSVRDRALASIAGQIMSKRLIGTVREEMGAVYSISASGSMAPLGGSNAILQSIFPMKPEMKDEVLGYIADQFDDMTKNISQEEFASVIEYMVKNARENLEKNESWRNAIVLAEAVPGIDTMNGIIELYQSLTPSDVTDFMSRLQKQNNYHVIILDPKETDNK